MAQYGYVPTEKINALQQSYSVSNPTSWTIERNGATYGGVEEVIFTDIQKSELIGLGGGWFATVEDFQDWMLGSEAKAVPAFLISEQVSATRILVCNLPILTGSNSFVLDVTIKDSGFPDRISQLVCTNSTTLPDGQGGQIPEFQYLVYALQNGANLFSLTRQMLQLRNSQGYFDL